MKEKAEKKQTDRKQQIKEQAKKKVAGSGGRGASGREKEREESATKQLSKTKGVRGKDNGGKDKDNKVKERGQGKERSNTSVTTSSQPVKPVTVILKVIMRIIKCFSITHSQLTVLLVGDFCRSVRKPHR